MNNFILIGFDRSGTSAISRTLSEHPEIELIFRPFNSGPIRQTMYQLLDDSNVDDRDKSFFKNLEKGKLDTSYFVSQWHEKFSTVTDSFKKDKLHVIITNINHFSVRWVHKVFPRIEQWAIWRDPEDILNSCIKNEFYGAWYADALEQVTETVQADSELRTLFGEWVSLVQTANYTIKTAFLIAVRNYFLFSEIEANKVIDYDIFRTNPNQALKPVLEYFDLKKSFDFSPYLNIDLNSIPSVDGYSANKPKVNIIDSKDLDIAKRIFMPLKDIYNTKFSL